MNSQSDISAVTFQDSLKVVVLIFGGENGKNHVRGSGMFTSKDGHILTNAHVVTNQQTGNAWPEITIYTTSDAHQPAHCYASAQVLAADPQLDLALLQIVSPLNEDCNPIDVLSGDYWYLDPKTDSTVPDIGSELTAIGYPLYGSFDDKTVTITRGHVSGFVGGDELHPTFFKTDTLLNHGNSGGAAFDKEGLFVGITAAFRSDTSNVGGTLGLLIPADVVNQWLEKLRSQGILQTTPVSSESKS